MCISSEVNNLRPSLQLAFTLSPAIGFPLSNVGIGQTLPGGSHLVTKPKFGDQSALPPYIALLLDNIHKPIDLSVGVHEQYFLLCCVLPGLPWQTTTAEAQTNRKLDSRTHTTGSASLVPYLLCSPPGRAWDLTSGGVRLRSRFVVVRFVVFTFGFFSRLCVRFLARFLSRLVLSWYVWRQPIQRLAML